jgi:2-polyprenyl-3-methyl-5-hydroxy-6-metoxy-1,4-benzoquinol methylase
MRKSERFWDKAAKGFDDRVNEGDEAAIILIDHTGRYLQPNDTVLDYGCATGKYAFEIAPQVKEVWGIDISSEMITAAKRNAAVRNIANVRFMQAEITDSRLEDESFNIILAYNILHLVDHPPRVVERIKELLKPDGIFISVTPCLGAGGSLLVSLIKFVSFLGITPKVHSFKPDEVETLIADAHFEILDNQVLSDSTSNIFVAARRIMQVQKMEKIRLGELHFLEVF